MKLVAMRDIPQKQQSELQAIDPELDIVIASREDWDHLLRQVADADVVLGSFGGGSGEAFRTVVDAAKNVRWIHTSSAGVDEILFPGFFDRNILLTCGKGESVGSLLAEHAMAMLLALTRQLVKAARTDAWKPQEFRGSVTEVRGMRMGILGFGAVGNALAKRAIAFEMRVLGVRNHPKPAPPGVEAVWGPDRLPELLSLSDVVVLALPNTPETLHSFGESQLRQMKPTALLINVGRGQTMDGKAIERALTEGWIAGAGLDVMPEEPWPSDSALWHLDHVLITPHYAGISPQRAGRDIELFVANYRRFIHDEPLASMVAANDEY